MPRLLLFIFLLTGFSKLYSQSQTLGISKDFLKSSTDLQTVSLNNVIAYVSNNSDKKVDIVATDYSLKKKWNLVLDGYLHTAENLGGNILILASTDFTLFTRFNSEFKAYLINTSTGKILKEKMLYEGDNSYHTIPYALMSRDNKRFTLATRETGLKRTMKVGVGAIGLLYTIKKTTENGNKIKSFNVATFDENLEPIEKISPDLPEGNFVGVERTVNNDLYIAVAENKKGITISKYPAGKDVSAKTVTESFSVSGGLFGLDQLNEHVHFAADTINNNTVYIWGSFRTDNEFLTMFNRYDFESGNHKKFNKVFTQQDIRELEKLYTPVNKDLKKLSIAHPKFLKVKKAVIDDTGYYLVISDTQYSPASQSSPPSPFCDGIILFSLDKNLKEKSLLTIPRAYSGVYSAQYAMYKQNSKMYLLTSIGDRAQFLAAKINTESAKLESLQVIEPDNSGRADEPNLNNAVLTGNALILPAWDFKAAFGKIKFDVNLYQLRW